jgi:GT2 family glycosyltransferase
MSSIKLSVLVSVIIVNYKSWTHLENCLLSLEHIQKDRVDLEVIIVDNYSNDGKLKNFKNKFTAFSFFENSANNGFANGCNLGASKAKGKYLFFLNPDTLVTEDPIQKMIHYLESNPTSGIVSCKQKNEAAYEKTHRFFPKLITLFGFLRAINKSYLIKKIEIKADVIYPDWVSGACVFISRSWFDKINGWNEDYWMYFEDVDLSKKIRDKGAQVALLTNTEIIHNHGGASRINLKTAVITKTEVLISKHVYIGNHFYGIQHFTLQFLTVLTVVIGKFVLGLLGLVFFFLPRFRLNLILFFKAIKYYIFAITKQTWLSEKSMNHQNKSIHGN